MFYLCVNAPWGLKHGLMCLSFNGYVLKIYGCYSITFLIEPMYLIGVWFNADSKNKNHKDTRLKGVALRLQNSTLNNEKD
jgi:hypothetical protein